MSTKGRSTGHASDRSVGHAGEKSPRPDREKDTETERSEKDRSVGHSKDKSPRADRDKEKSSVKHKDRPGREKSRSSVRDKDRSASKDTGDRERESSLDRDSLLGAGDVLDVLEDKPSPAVTAREQEALDQLAMLFTIQEERCVPDFGSRDGGSSELSRASLTHSQMSDASFIYQHIDFDLLAKCVPGFVRNHLNKNGRYLPETFILRVNYLRRRRALGVDGGGDKRAAKESISRSCSDVTSSPRAASSRGQTVKGATSPDGRVTLASG